MVATLVEATECGP